MKNETITIYIGKWNDREFACDLSYDRARTLVEDSYAFGDPAIDQHAVGNKWATDFDDDGWRIVTHNMAIAVISVDVKASGDAETAHLVWQCPYCNKYVSDDWRSSDNLPMLLCCGCQDSSKYLLATKPVAGA